MSIGIRTSAKKAATFVWLTMFAVGLLSGAQSADAQPASKPGESGWRWLFDGSNVQAWRGFKKEAFPDHGWRIEDGWLHCLGQGGGDIITREVFDDFELEWEWKIAPSGNSGVKYFLTEQRGSPIGHEYQLIDDERHPDAKVADGKHLTAGVYDVLKPTGVKPNPAGQINHSRIVLRGNHVEHWLNGREALTYECGSEAFLAAVARSKFRRVSGFGRKIPGHILLQDHHSEVWFRNIRIRVIENN